MPANSPKHWQPPKDGSIKINCAARTTPGIGGYSSMACDSNGDLVAVIYGRMKCKSPLEAQMHCILTAFELVEKLGCKNVSIETHHKRALGLINGDDEIYELDEIEAEEERNFGNVSENIENDDDEEYRVTLVGAEELEKLPQEYKDLVKKDNLLAGLTASKEVIRTPKAEGNNQSVISVALKKASQASSSEGPTDSKKVSRAPVAEANSQGACSVDPIAEGLALLKVPNQVGACSVSSKNARKASTTAEGATASKEASQAHIAEGNNRGDSSVAPPPYDLAGSLETSNAPVDEAM